MAAPAVAPKTHCVNPLSSPVFNHTLNSNDLHTITAWCSVNYASVHPVRARKTQEIDDSGSWLEEWLINVEHGLIQNKDCMWVSVSIEYDLDEQPKETTILVPSDVYRRRYPPSSSDVDVRPAQDGLQVESWKALCRELDMLLRRAEIAPMLGRPESVHSTEAVRLFRHQKFEVGRRAQLIAVEAICGSSTFVFRRREHCESETQDELKTSVEMWLEDVKRFFVGTCETIGVKYVNMQGEQIGGWGRVALPQGDGERRPFAHANGFALLWELFVEGLENMQWYTCSGEPPKADTSLPPSDEALALYLIDETTQRGGRQVNSIEFACKHGRSGLAIAPSNCPTEPRLKTSQAVLRGLQGMRDRFRNRGLEEECSIVTAELFDEEHVWIATPFAVKLFNDTAASHNARGDEIILEWEHFVFGVEHAKWPTCDPPLQLQDLPPTDPSALPTAETQVPSLLEASTHPFLFLAEPLADAMGINQNFLAYYLAFLAFLTILGLGRIWIGRKTWSARGENADKEARGRADKG